jgi:predicted ATP-grasp superfamily ATP-dependent carboligase
MQPRSVLLLDGGTSYAWGVVRCLAEDRNIRIHLLSRSVRIPLRYSRLIASFSLWGGVFAPSAVEDARQHAKRVNADLVLAADEGPIAFLAAHGSSLGTPSMLVPAPRQFDVAQDKWELARFLNANGLPHPPTTTYGGDEAGRRCAVPFPVLIKPRLGGYGAGIRRFETPDALIHHFSNVTNAETFVVQSVLDGQDIDCSVLCRDGQILAYTIQRPFLPAIGYRPAGGVEFVHDDRVLDVVTDLMRALHWNGLAHVDLRYDAGQNRLVILEINPRFWGSIVGSLHAGVNFPVLACRAALGESFRVPTARACRYVAGVAATSCWLRGRFGRRRAGFTPADTVFRYALSDPLPWLTGYVLPQLPRIPIRYTPHEAVGVHEAVGARAAAIPFHR